MDKSISQFAARRESAMAGINAEVLMLSATPVNNRFVDLKNQLAIAYEGNSENLDERLNTTKSLEDIFKQAQKAFNAWSKLDQEQRTTDALLRTLDFDFFELLDSVTIARSRKHIEKYYDTNEIGKFPERMKPISVRPCLTDLNNAINYNEIYDQLMQLMQRLQRKYFFLSTFRCKRSNSESAPICPIERKYVDC